MSDLIEKKNMALQNATKKLHIFSVFSSVEFHVSEILFIRFRLNCPTNITQSILNSVFFVPLCFCALKNNKS